MPHRVIVISPDAKLATSLQDAFATSGMDVDLTLIDEYPTLGQLKAVTGSESEPVAAFIVGLSESDLALELIQRLQTSYGNALIVGADLAVAADTMLAVMRAGASEFLAPPFDLSYMRDAFTRRRMASSEACQPGQLSCILPAKAASGASTLAIHLAADVARVSQTKTLLVDYDFHGSMTAFRLRLHPDFTFLDALARAGDIDEMWKKIACPAKHFDLLAAPPQDEIVSGEALRKASAIFSSALRSYAHVLVDLPPGAHSSCRDVLEVADTILLVSTPEVTTLHLARHRIHELTSMGISENKLRLVVNRADSTGAVRAEDIADVAGIPVHWSIPNNYAAVSEAAFRGVLVADNSPLGRQYAALACEIAGVKPQVETKSQKRKWKSFLPLQVAKAPGTS